MGRRSTVKLQSRALQGVNQLKSGENSPPQMRRGGAKRRGGVDTEIDFLERTAPALRATRLNQGGEFALSNSFTPSFSPRSRCAES
jgi:hypothetical protein